LQTIDRQPVRVLHPGFWNHEAGPDFRGAVIQIGQAEPRSGDVELDLTQRDWQAHQHDKNPNFANVILHVVWNDDAKPSLDIPTLALEPFLDAPLHELQGLLGGAGELPDMLRGACSAPLGQLTREQSEELLRQAAIVRFQRKGLELESRARQSGWDQALWEGLLRGLGYKQNVWPMQQIAELLPRLSDGATSPQAWQARLLGVSGFLGAAHERGSQDEYLRSLWDHWWRERERFQEHVMPRALWRLHGLRPANQPQRRLALASHWLASGDFTARLEQWFTAGDTALLPETLTDCLQPARDEFWSHHWSFQSPRLPKVQPLLGESRATDLAINVILPWFWTRARAGRNERLAKLAEDRYLAWPAAQDNSLLRLARQRLLGRQPSRGLKSAASQQGLLQIVRDFCDHSNALCTDCAFPEMVRSLVR